jgi:hypothetical protein
MIQWSGTCLASQAIGRAMADEVEASTEKPTIVRRLDDGTSQGAVFELSNGDIAFLGERIDLELPEGSSMASYESLVFTSKRLMDSLRAKLDKDET